MKYFLTVLFLFISLAGFTMNAQPVAAQDCGPENGYCPLSPLPGLGEQVTPDETLLADYINMLYQYGVGVAIALAIVMLVVGGVQYMTSASSDGKEGGRGRITAAIIGLLLALGSYVLLVLIGGQQAVDLDFDRDTTLPGAPDPTEEDDDVDSLVECMRDNMNEGSEGLSPRQMQLACEEGAPIASFDNSDMDMSTTACQQLNNELREDAIRIEAEELFKTACRDALNGNIYNPNLLGTTLICVDPDNQCEQGTTDACFQEIQQNAQLGEKEIMCDSGDFSKNYRNAESDYENIEFKVDIENAPYDELGGCYQLSAGEMEEFARDECDGRLDTFDDPNQLDGTYCITPSNNTACQEATEGEFMTLSDLDDKYWDENLCDVRDIPSGPSVEQRQELEELFEQFANEMGVDALQTSGYYNDTNYQNNHSPDGEPHAGIDLDGATGDAIKAPVSGDVVKLWDANDEQYTNNGKVGIIDDSGKLWVFTHIQNMENIGSSVEVGDQIAEVGVDGGGGSHIHMEVHNDASVAYNGGDPQDPYGSLRGGLHDGTMTESQAQENTACPLQAYWESINEVSS